MDYQLLRKRWLFVVTLFLIIAGGVACAASVSREDGDANIYEIDGEEVDLLEGDVVQAEGAPVSSLSDEGVSEVREPATEADDNGDASADGETVSEGTTEDVEAAETEDVASQDEANKTYDAEGIEVGFTEEGNPYRGDLKAEIVLEEFSDFQCPFCARFTAQTLPSLVEDQIASGEMVVIYYDFPLTSIHPQAFAAANAARCAGEEGAAYYWAMHDQLFANIGEWSINKPNTVFAAYGEAVGLSDLDAYNVCLDENRYEDAINADLALGQTRGVRSTPSFFVNDQPLVGAQPLSVFNQAITAVQNGESIASAQSPRPSEQQPSVRPTPAPIPLDTAAGSMGDPNAPITIVEYTDYQCPFCQRHSVQTMPQIVSNMIEAGQVYYILKDFPLDSLHPAARYGAVAARCAGEQDAYWEMHDAIFASQEQWGGQGAASQAIFTELATELGLDSTAYASCLESGRYDDAVQANLLEGQGLGVQGTPFFFIDGFPVNGAQPYEVFEYAVGLAAEGTLADAYVRNEPAPEPQQPTEPQGPVDVPLGDAFRIGDPDAPVVIVEYTDFQCPFCSRHFSQTYPQIKEQYIDTGLVQYVFKDFPLTQIHPQAVVAAEAARCAGDQDAFLEMHDVLFANQGQWNGRSDVIALFVGYAEELGLEAAAFKTCMEDHVYEEAVLADLQEGVELGVRGTPTFFVNGIYLSGAQPFPVFQQAIDSFVSE